ncbi:MAG: hypothetical protein QM572_05495 [Nocardioides sp.]|uniref:hypothetical protein n=1 Tax=Nocardioides sp. TaxID=35761 RepID=UPI0039E4C81E
MLALGLIMVLLGALLLVIGLFTGGQSDDGTATLLGIHLGTEGVFVAGAVAAALILLGLSTTRWGAARGWRRRRELKEKRTRLDELEREIRKDESD